MVSRFVRARGTGRVGARGSALQMALGVQFEGPDGEHFFRSTLVQTLFYGVFSAWVNQAKDGASTFDWRTAGYSLHVPTINVLFSEIAKPTRLGPLKLNGILDRTAQVLNRVNKTTFFVAFDTSEAIQHFYEPFLKNFDPNLRKQLGVWYTPREVVKYMVERVDQTLKTELNITDGLADKNVYVLDPCCGTGAYLIEVLRKIEVNLRASGAADAMLADDIKDAALTRIFGFEIMSAPYVVAHWQVGNLLARLKATIDADKNERPAIYLTNALTGWAPPKGGHKNIPLFPEFEEERDKAEHVKRDVPILVVLGNPPYNAYAGVSPEEEQGLVDPYKQGLNQTWGIKKFNLDELYLRFLRVAERRIVEGTGRGIVCFISSYSYLSDTSFVVARRHLLDSFQKIWIDSLNGDSRETGKTTPDGKPDPSVFSTDYNREGIKLGTAIGLFVRSTGVQAGHATVRYRDFWGAHKRLELLASLDDPKLLETYTTSTSLITNRFDFRPRLAAIQYAGWPTLIELAAEEPFSGAVEKRKGSLISHDRAELNERISKYVDPDLSFDLVHSQGVGPIEDAAGFDARKVRQKLIAAGGLNAGRIVRFCMHPFDYRWCFHTDVPLVWNRARPELAEQQAFGNLFLVSRIAARRPDEGVPLVATRALPNDHLLDPNSHPIPVEIHRRAKDLFGDSQTVTANLSGTARTWLLSLGWPNPDGNYEAAAGPWLHTLAIAYSPTWLDENRGEILAGWPRVPLPSTRAMLESSSALGSRIANLLDPDQPVPGVTAGSVSPVFQLLGTLTSKDDGQLKSADLLIDAGWGHGGKGAPVMPGQGRITKLTEYDEKTGANLEAEAQRLNLSYATLIERLGPPINVWLNDKAYWLSVPQRVWGYSIGGYPVIKKWLSYREGSVLGRSITKEEARYVTHLIRRLTALVMLGPALDVNYEECRHNAADWSAFCGHPS